MNILVYLPKRPILRKSYRLSLDWIYGADIIKELQARHPEWSFEVADGSRSETGFFVGIDVYLRPSRCDGWSIMCKEAEHCNVPVIWSFDSGDYIEPNVDDIERRLIELEENIRRSNIQV